MKKIDTGRRSFLGKALAAVSAAIVAPRILFDPSTASASNSAQPLSLFTVNLTDYPALNVVGGSVALKIPGATFEYKPYKYLPFRFILTRSGANSFLAEEGYCPHQQSPLSPYDGTYIRCPLPVSDGHGSNFAIDGTVINDPAKRNLNQYTTDFDFAHNTVTISVANLIFAGVSSKEHASELYQNYPNPVKNSTSIGFRLVDDAHVTLTIIDMRGHIITVLNDGRLQAGEHSFNFDASIWNSGTYLYQLNIEGKVITKEMIVAK